MNIAAKVAADKEKNPADFCPSARCLWRTHGGYCPRHRPMRIVAIRCAWCEERIGETTLDAGYYEERNGGEITLHKICAEFWDKEQSELVPLLEASIEQAKAKKCSHCGLDPSEAEYVGKDCHAAPDGNHVWVEA